MNRRHVSLYADGSCVPNPGIGGYAAIIRDGRNQKEVIGRIAHCTNNRAELTAVMQEALYDYRRTAGSASFKQVLDCVKHPAENIRVKRVLYRHLREMHRKKGLLDQYGNRLWMSVPGGPGIISGR